MRTRTLRLAIGAAIAAGMTFAPTAGAQGTWATVMETAAPVVDRTFYTVAPDGVNYENQAGDTVALLYSVRRQQEGSAQSLAGEIGGLIFTGVAYDHTYERAGDHGHYTVQGTVDASGASLPFYGTLTFEYDRTRWANVWVLNGDINGTPIGRSVAVGLPLPF